MVGSSTSNEVPMRYRCVRPWHVLQSKHLMCLRAKKLAPCTDLSHFLHRNALSAWQYNEAHDSQSSQATVAWPETASFRVSVRLKQPSWLGSSSLPLHILGVKWRRSWRQIALYNKACVGG
ncbi:B-box type zinc finger family protein [Actinidia rufa]|uniref:B-box type zinc finger family protein n=1 Tax=Actinidia rufa TaxID=165716 RepID=A0A7J0FKA8_9ERIC|nr:B-box type zinc finger family protein [Actinidia rufa]